jgi:hypothetical protein
MKQNNAYLEQKGTENEEVIVQKHYLLSVLSSTILLKRFARTFLPKSFSFS